MLKFRAHPEPWAYHDLINQKWLKLSWISKCKQKHEDKLGFLSNEGDSSHMWSHQVERNTCTCVI